MSSGPETAQDPTRSKEHRAREREAEALHVGEAARCGPGYSDRPVGRVHSWERRERGCAARGLLPEPGNEMSRWWDVEALAPGRSDQGC